MPHRLPQAAATHILPAPMAAGYMPMVASPTPANVGIYAMPQHNFQPYATPHATAPMVVSYSPMVATPTPANVGYETPAVAPRTYWTDLVPVARTLAPTHPAELFPPMGPPSSYRNQLPMFTGHGVPASPGQQFSYGYYGQNLALPHGVAIPRSTMQQEGSVLGQPSLLVHGQAPKVQPGDPNSVEADAYDQGCPTDDHRLFDGSVRSRLRDSWQGHKHSSVRSGCRARCCSSPWSVGLGGLLMSRDDENYYRFSYDGANELIQLTNARDANFNWARGFELSATRRFNCDRNAVEAVYWRLFPGVGTTVTTDADTAGALNGILNWDQLNYGLDPFLVPWTADDFANNSTVHMVQRENKIQNAELNLLTFLSGDCGPTGATIEGDGKCGGCAACGGDGEAKRNGLLRRATLAGRKCRHGKNRCDAGCGSRWSHDWLFGVRFFQFRDHLLFGAERAGGNYDFLFEDDEIYYNIDVTNDLFGLQLGSSGAYAVSCRCSLDYDIKFGLYANHISHTSEIGGSQGIATINNGPNLGVDFYVQNTKNDVAFLGEAKLGLSWQFSNCWSAKLGYRAVAVTGVALPTNQIYPDLRGIQDVRRVDSNGSLILHGGYSRLEYRF